MIKDVQTIKHFEEEQNSEKQNHDDDGQYKIFIILFFSEKKTGHIWFWTVMVMEISMILFSLFTFKISFDYNEDDLKWKLEKKLEK